jgi:hypothetical protein
MGDCTQFMVEVTSQRPGFLVDCAQAKTANASKQQVNVIQTRVLRMIPPNWSRRLRAAPSNFTSLRDGREIEIS